MRGPAPGPLLAGGFPAAGFSPGVLPLHAWSVGVAGMCREKKSRALPGALATRVVSLPPPGEVHAAEPPESSNWGGGNYNDHIF